jgi:hypothetical protein
MPAADQPLRARVRRILPTFLLACLLTAGYATPLLFLALVGLLGARGVWPVVVLVVASLAVVAACTLAIRRFGRRPFRIAAEGLVLIVFVGWGLAYSHTATTKCVSCTASAYRPLAEPEVIGLIVLHVLQVLAYAVSRRRPNPLSHKVELLLSSTLMTGLVLQALLAVHFGVWLLGALVVTPVLVPCAAPLFTIVLYAHELHDRWSRIGNAVAGATAPAAVPARPVTWWAALGLSTLWLGLYALISALWRGHASAALDVVTRTCGYTLSQIPIVQTDCHYLCTVAARGHRWLVRPERIGWRHGKPIVVNRQLAVANAFEDWLTERWPRTGRLARRIYDGCGLPVSKHLQTPWRADLTYLLMKPFEWAFLLVLLLCDPGSPESRIDRMYRA